MTYQPQRFTAPDGTEMVVLKAEDFDRLRALVEDGEDLADAMAIKARIDAGEETVPGAVVHLMVVDGLSPLGAWRRHRGLSQAALAKQAGLSQVWVSRIEAGGGYGSRETRRKLAAALDAPVWALEEESATPKMDSAEAIAERFSLNAKSYRARLRREIAWYSKQQDWRVAVGSPEHRDMLRVAGAMGGDGTK